MNRPNFLIIGAAKSGTTSIMEYLNGHPDVYMSEWKEPAFFADSLDNRLKNYHEYLQLFKGAGDAKIIGEASTAYLFDKNAAKNIFDKLGDIKLIVILRDPIEMAYSLWHYNIAAGVENLSFKDAFVNEELRIKEFNLNKDSPIWVYRYAYKSRAKYYNQIKVYLDYFSHKNIKVYIFEEFFSDPEKNYNDIITFLGLEPISNIDFKRYNKGGGYKITYLQKLMSTQNTLKKIIRCITNKKIRIRIFNFLNNVNKDKKYKKNVLSLNDKLFYWEYFKNDVNELEHLLDRKIDCWGNYK